MFDSSVEDLKWILLVAKRGTVCPPMNSMYIVKAKWYCIKETHMADSSATEIFFSRSCNKYLSLVYSRPKPVIWDGVQIGDGVLKIFTVSAMYSAHNGQ